MPTIVRNSPFFDRPTTVALRGRTVPVKRDQIIVWVSLSETGLEQLHAETPRLPAILDPGCNHNFISERHLTAWAGIRPEYLARFANIRVDGRVALQLAANVWLHPNRSGERDAFSSERPFQLELLEGIAVLPMPEGTAPYPRLPTLGLRAFRRAGLHIHIDCRRCRVTIRTPSRLWPFS